MRKGFTLAETLVAVSLFTIAAVVASNVLVDIVDLEKKTDVQNSIYEDARILMQQITNEIHNGTIDYEEYFNIQVMQSKKEDKFYGINYGIYASRFYDPGKSLDGAPTKNPEDLGVECSVFRPAPNADECEIIYTHSNDLNTGKNPFGGAEDDADAFCHQGVVACQPGRNAVDELYLIDSSGTHKTIIGHKVMDETDKSVGIVRMTGKDYDQNGLVDIFSCDDGYTCTDEGLGAEIFYPFVHDLGAGGAQTFLNNNGIKVPKKSDLPVPFFGHLNNSQFLPFSPSRANVADLKFIIHPFEDPYKAYAEKAVQGQPTVTIVLTMELSKKEAANYPGEFEKITIQETVAAGVRGKIESYPPVSDLLKADNKSWIEDARSYYGVGL